MKSQVKIDQTKLSDGKISQIEFFGLKE